MIFRCVSLCVFSVLSACWMDQSSYLSERLRFEDRDGDGFTPNDGDCNDDDPMFHPDADEICDDRDNNCDYLIDEYPVIGPVWYIEGESGCMDQAIVSCTEPTVPFVTTAESCD